MIRLTVLLFAVILSAATAARADTAEGERLFEALDYAGARAALEPEATGGDLRAMVVLGIMDEEGRGAPANYSRAAAWYRAAADRGDAEGQSRLASLYERGQGVPLDYATAILWYRRAGDQGYAPAQTRLGIMLLAGRGTNPDPDEARAWLDKAAAQGEEDALIAILELDGATRTDDLEGVVPGAPPPPEEDADVSALSSGAFALRERLVAALAEIAPDGAPLHHGALEIREDGARYLARLDDVALVDPETGRAFRLGTLRGVFTPVGEQVYRVTLTLPQLIAVEDATGTQVGHLTIGSQRIEGQWIADLDSFTVLDIDLQDIDFAEEDGAPALSIARIAHRHDLVADETGRYTGNATGTVEDVQAFDDGGINALAIGAVTYRQDVRGLDSRFLGSLGAGLGVFGGVYDEGTGHPMLAGLPGKLSEVAGALATEVTFSRLMVADPAGGGQMRIADLAFRLALDDLDRNVSRIGLGYSHHGLVLEEPSVASGSVPGDAEIDLALNNLPLDGVVDAVVASIMQPMTEGGGEDFVSPVMTFLDEAGTELVVNRIALRLPEADAQLNGSVRADATNPSGFAGSLLLEAFGLEQLVSLLSQDPNRPGDQQIGGFMALLNAFGTDALDASGRTVRSFRFEMGADGEPTVNGQPLGALMMGAPTAAE